MDGSSHFAPRIISGIDVLDQAWGGLFRGGRYLVYGTTASGRSLFTTSFVAAATNLLEPSLLVSRLRETDLAIQSASVGFDQREAAASGILRVSRTPFELELIDRDDNSLESSLKALASLIVDSSADRVVIDDFSAFARFSSFDRFRTAFARLVTEIERVPATVLLAMPEPANEASRRVIDYISSLMTGCVHVHLKCVEGFSQRTISLIPQIGHLTRRIDLTWNVERIIARAEDVAGTLAPPKTRIGPPAETPGDLRDVTPATSEPAATEAEEQAAREPEPQMEEVSGELGSFEFSVEPATDVGEEDEELVFLNRERFTDELQLYFDDFEASAAAFTLVAMRTEARRGESASDDFGAILHGLQSVLGREDSLFADPATERIIVILGEGDSRQAQELFSRLRNRLRDADPHRADHLLNAVSAVVVPDGQPFSTAEEFVAYVLDEKDADGVST